MGIFSRLLLFQNELAEQLTIWHLHSYLLLVGWAAP
jgi:hypothetical protein